MYLARSASSLWESRQFVHQRLRTVDLGSEDSLSTLVKTPNPHFENAKNSVRDCFRRQQTKPPLLRLLVLFCSLWVFGALLLLTVESSYDAEDHKRDAEKRLKTAQERLLKAYWKMNQFVKADSQQWNESALSLLHWFEHQHGEHQLPVFQNLQTAWLFFLFVANSVGGVPGYHFIRLSDNGRALVLATFGFSLIIYYFALWSLAELFNSISKPNQFGLTAITVMLILVKAWLQALSYSNLGLPGTWFQWISVMGNYRAFQFPSASPTIAFFYLLNHMFLWTVVFIIIQKFEIWRSHLYLQVVSNLDSETALLVMLPDLKLDRAEHLIHKYSQSSIWSKMKASLLKEEDKHKIVDFIEAYQERTREETSYF